MITIIKQFLHNSFFTSLYGIQNDHIRKLDNHDYSSIDEQMNATLTCFKQLRSDYEDILNYAEEYELLPKTDIEALWSEFRENVVKAIETM